MAARWRRRGLVPPERAWYLPGVPAPVSDKRHHAPVARAVFALVLLVGAEARADVASWMFAGGGSSLTANGEGPLGSQPALQFETGVGTLPRSGFSFGGLMRLQSHLGDGSDVALFLRSASSGYIRGDWGIGLDVGGFQRWWGVGSSGALAAIVLGAPWGISASIGGGVGSNDTRVMSAVVGLDLARLTAYRRTGLSFWPNPFRAGDNEER